MLTADFYSLHKQSETEENKCHKKGVMRMPYRKDKQMAFQEAQEGTKEIKDVVEKMDVHGSDYGSQQKLLAHKLNTVTQQIENAFELASEHQRIQLEQYQQELRGIAGQFIE